MRNEIINLLEREGYTSLKEVKGRGMCGIFRYLYTTGLVYGLDEEGYKGRYCYSESSEAKEALESWSGEGDPTDENWIKHKGQVGEYSNPKES